MKQGVMLIGLTRETNRADKADVDDVLVAETGSTEVYLVLSWDGQGFTNGRWGEEGHL